MVWAGTTHTRPLRLAATWARQLADVHPPAACIWSANPVPRTAELDGVVWCWHRLELPPRIDRHAANAHPRQPWSPWGSKSGPNYQFFQVLDQFADAHPHDWLLYTEPDTFPVGQPADAIRDLGERHGDAWMIGGHAHPTIRDQLEPAMHHHLNGAALYRAGSAAFRQFRQLTWIPSLLWRIRARPEYAYDCLTDPSQHTDLPARLAAAWATAEHRFVATSGIVNLSTRTLTVADAHAAVCSAELETECRREGTVPWMFHAKGPIGTSLLAPLDASHD